MIVMIIRISLAYHIITHQFVPDNAIQHAEKNVSLPSYAPLRLLEQVKDATNACQPVLVHPKGKTSQEQIAKPKDST